jgi:hypothetical protein
VTEDPAGFTLEDILRRKSEARVERARNLTIGQKIAIVERMRAEMAPFAAIRERNRQRRLAQRAAKQSGGENAVR